MSFGQKSINLIISIDNQVVVGSLSNIKLDIIKDDETKEVFKLNYSPGDLSITDSNYSMILSHSIKQMILTFNHSEYCKGEQKTYYYEIEFKKSWIENQFTVINIYNTNKRLYKNVYFPLPNKTYTYEVIYPGGFMMRLKRKKIMSDCDE